MTVRHVPWLRNRDRWFILTHSGPPRVSIHTPHSESSIEMSRRSFGAGFEFNFGGGRIRLSLYFGRLGSVWLRHRSRLTKWAKPSGLWDRLVGVRLFYMPGVWLQINLWQTQGAWSRDDPWWHEISFGARQLWGRTSVDTELVDSGTCRVPLPEGPYLATWKKERFTRRYVRWPGTWRRARQHVSFSLDIPGGIPVEGKGTESYNCGMDGLFGISSGAKTLESLIGEAVASVLTDRRKYGGPHNLDRPTRVSEA